MRKYLNLLLVCSFLFYASVSVGQQLETKSTVKISENELTSLIKVLKKYKIQHSIVIDSVKKTTILLSENTKVYTLNSTIPLKISAEYVSIERDTLYNAKITSEKILENKNNYTSEANLQKKEILVNSDELINLQNEIKELKTVINALVINQNNANYIDRNRPKTIKETKIIHENNSIPKSIISETIIHKTDTLFIIENVKTTDSILFIKLQEKINFFELRLKENDSILNSLIKTKLEKSDVHIVQSEQNKTLKAHFNDLFFENNQFELSIDNQNILMELVSLDVTNKTNHIYLKGFASNSGNSNYNKKLSLKRAESVKNYLIKNGIEADRISTNFFGIDYNASNEAKARRVEISLFNN